MFNSLFSKLGPSIKKSIFEIVILDNNSTDKTQETIKKYFKDKEELFADSNLNDSKKSVRFYRSSENLGYAKGINKAAGFSRGEILVVINPDSELESEDFDKVIADFSNHTKTAVLGMKIRDLRGNDEKTAGKFFNPFTFLLYSIGLESVFSLRFSGEKREKVDFVSGGFVSFRREAFEKVDGYDEDFFMYVEDMDICYRLKELGYEIWYAPYATIKHRGQGSSNREFAILNIYKGFQIFYTKHASFLELLYIKNLLSLKAALIIFLGTLLGKKELVKTYSRALKTIV